MNVIFAYLLMLILSVSSIIETPDQTGSRVLHPSQISVDFVGYVVAAQTNPKESKSVGISKNKKQHRKEGDPLPEQFSIHDVLPGMPSCKIASVKLNDYDSCTGVTTFRGKMYGLCTNADDRYELLMFDYLK